MLFSHLFLRCFHRRFSQVFSLHLRQLFAKRPPAFSVLGGVVGGGFLTSGTEGGQKDPFLHVFFERWKLFAVFTLFFYCFQLVSCCFSTCFYVVFTAFIFDNFLLKHLREISPPPIKAPPPALRTNMSSGPLFTWILRLIECYVTH